MFPLAHRLFCLLSFSNFVFAAPNPHPQPPPPALGNPADKSTYTVTNHWQFTKNWRMATGATCTGDCNVGEEESVTIGFGWSIGGDLGIDLEQVNKVFSASVSGSVQWYHETTSTDTIAQNCKEGYVCGLMVREYMEHVEGFHDGYIGSSNVGGNDFYSFDAPVKIHNKPRVDFKACVSKNSPTLTVSGDLDTLCPEDV